MLITLTSCSFIDMGKLMNEHSERSSINRSMDALDHVTAPIAKNSPRVERPLSLLPRKNTTLKDGPAK
jgi:hypothetical protein